MFLSRGWREMRPHEVVLALFIDITVVGLSLGMMYGFWSFLDSIPYAPQQPNAEQVQTQTTGE